MKIIWGRLYFHMEVVLINAHFLNASETDITLGREIEKLF